MIVDSVFTSMPCSKAMVAKVCRRSWKRMDGSSAYRSSVFIRRYAVYGDSGSSGTVGLWKIQSLYDFFFRAFRISTVLGGS